MAKEIQMSVKMEPELHEQFMALSARLHRPAAQIVRELMRAYLVRQETPNEETIAAIQAVERGEVSHYETVDDCYRKLGF